MTTTRVFSADETKLLDIVENARIGMLVTAGEEKGSFHSRPMSFIEVDRDALIVRMFAAATSHKEEELGDHARASISVMNLGSQDFVSLSGVVRISADMALKKRLWKPIHLAFYPNGPEDSDLNVLEFQIESGDYWDAPDSKIVQLAGMARAILTKRPYRGGDSGHVEGAPHLS